MGSISAWQILLLVVVIVVVFGARRLPDVASNLGKSLKIFKREVSDLSDPVPPPGQTSAGGAASTEGRDATGDPTGGATPPDTPR